MEAQAFGFDLGAIDFRSCDRGRVTTRAQTQPDRDIRMQIAERAERRQQETTRSHTMKSGGLGNDECGRLS